MSKFKTTPFTVNVYDLMHRPGQMREESREIGKHERLGEGLIWVPEDAPIAAALRLESVHEGILVSAEVEARAVGTCGRCLKDIEQDLQVDFQELFAYSSDEGFDHEVHDDHVDLEPVIRDAVVLALPFQPVCREDCLGLDPETGLPAAEVSSTDADVQVDPRWSALKDFHLPDEARPRGKDDEEKS